MLPVFTPVQQPLEQRKPAKFTVRVFLLCSPRVNDASLHITSDTPQKHRHSHLQLRGFYFKNVTGSRHRSQAQKQQSKWSNDNNEQCLQIIQV